MACIGYKEVFNSDFTPKHIEISKKIVTLHPVKRFIMNRTEITQSISRALHALPLQLDARLFGSEARGDARPDSDIDLLILVDQATVTDREEDSIFAPLYQIELQTGVLINPIIMPKQEWGRRISPFYLNVENEGVKL